MSISAFLLIMLSCCQRSLWKLLDEFRKAKESNACSFKILQSMEVCFEAPHFKEGFDNTRYFCNSTEWLLRRISDLLDNEKLWWKHVAYCMKGLYSKLAHWILVTFDQLSSRCVLLCIGSWRLDQQVSKFFQRSYNASMAALMPTFDIIIVLATGQCLFALHIDEPFTM